MRLSPFEHRHADLVLSWARSPAELKDWASLEIRPAAGIFAEWLADPDSHAWLLLDGAPIAYAELWVSAQESEVEIAHVIVAPARRGRGVGQRLVHLLVQEAGTLGVSTAWLRVAPGNVQAERCYLAAGFLRASAQREAELNARQPRPYLWLSRPLRTQDQACTTSS